MNYGKDFIFPEGFYLEVEDRFQGYEFVKKYGAQVPDGCFMGVSCYGKPDVAVERKLKVERPKSLKCLPGDLPEYISPVTGRPVDGRTERREEMKRHNLREVEPSEFKPCYRNPDFVKKHNIPEKKWGDPIVRPERVDVPLPDGARKLLKS